MLYTAITLILPTLAVASPRFVFQDQTLNPNDLFTVDVKVPVQLGVMSKCPDALLCEATFNSVLEQVKDKMDLSLVYIAKPNSSDPVFHSTCLHGPEECAGNVQQLCVAKYATQDQWWQFVQCQNFGGREDVGKPDVALKCASVARIDWETSGAGKCGGLDGSGTASEGVKLLQESMKLANTLHIEKSCTILISGRKVCVHDGTWKDCEDGHAPSDFIRQIDEEYDRLNGVRD